MITPIKSVENPIVAHLNTPTYCQLICEIQNEFLILIGEMKSFKIIVYIKSIRNVWPVTHIHCIQLHEWKRKFIKKICENGRKEINKRKEKKCNIQQNTEIIVTAPYFYSISHFHLRCYLYKKQKQKPNTKIVLSLSLALVLDHFKSVSSWEAHRLSYWQHPVEDYFALPK